MGGAIVDGGHPYKTRIIVRRPASPGKFNGTAVIEWNNVLILDLQLLQGTGLGVLRNLRGYRQPGTSVIVLTNYAIPSYRARSMELGADYFFDKTKDFSKIKDVFSEMENKKRAAAADTLRAPEAA